MTWQPTSQPEINKIRLLGSKLNYSKSSTQQIDIIFLLLLHSRYQRIVVSYNIMFNPKERLEQIRKNKSTREEVNTYIADTPSPPLFSLFSEPKPNNDSQDLISRISKLENIVNQLSNQLDSSKTVISSLRKENNDLENKLLKLEYENSQLKIVSSKVIEKQPSRRQISHSDRSSAQKDEREVRKSESNIIENEVLMVEVEQALQQIKKEPIENILKRKEHNFRALKTDPRQTNNGNKVLKEFATICKDYHKTLKKPLLVLKLQASDFE